MLHLVFILRKMRRRQEKGLLSLAADICIISKEMKVRYTREEIVLNSGQISRVAMFLVELNE